MRNDYSELQIKKLKCINLIYIVLWYSVFSSMELFNVDLQYVIATTPDRDQLRFQIFRLLCLIKFI